MSRAPMSLKLKIRGRELGSGVVAPPTAPPIPASPADPASPPSPPDQVVLIRMKEVQRRTGLARATIYRLMKLGTFPKPVRLITHNVAWRQHQVDAWIEGLQQL